MRGVDPLYLANILDHRFLTPDELATLLGQNYTTTANKFMSDAIRTYAFNCEEPEYPTLIHSEHRFIRQSAHLLEKMFL